MSRNAVAGVIALALLAVAASAAAQPMTSEAAVALAMARNRDVIAARLELQAVEVERLTARLYPNPILSYTAGNLVLGPGNPQAPANVQPRFFDQSVHTIGISEVIDVWAKRNTRMRTADRAIERQRLVLADALREIANAVRATFAEALREQAEHVLATATLARYEETLRLTRARRAAGDISENELKKVELESMRYRTALISADLQLDLARQKLAALLAYPNTGFLPTELSEDNFARDALSLDQLTERALERRPDLRAVAAERHRATAAVTQARREAFPELSLGLSYTRSNFTIAGDNPNALSLGLSLPLPLIDRNQGGIAHARVDVMRADNDVARIELQVRHEVADAVRRVKATKTLVDIYEGGMIERAEAALTVAEKSYKAGALSLLELLEAQRTYLETHGAYLRVVYDYRQANIDVIHAVGDEIK